MPYSAQACVAQVALHLHSYQKQSKQQQKIGQRVIYGVSGVSFRINKLTANYTCRQYSLYMCLLVQMECIYHTKDYRVDWCLKQEIAQLIDVVLSLIAQEQLNSFEALAIG